MGSSSSARRGQLPVVRLYMYRSQPTISSSETTSSTTPASIAARGMPEMTDDSWSVPEIGSEPGPAGAPVWQDWQECGLRSPGGEVAAVYFDVFGPSKDFDDACLIDENLCISLHALDDPCQCESLEPADGCSGDIPSDDDPTVCEW